MATQPMTPPPQPAAPGMAQPTSLDPQQESYRKIIVRQCMKMLLNEGAFEHLIAKAKATKDPAATLVQAVTPIVADSYRMASVAGKDVKMVTLLAAGLEVISVLAEGFARAGVIEDGDDKIAQFVTRCTQMAVQQHNMGAVAAKTQPAGGMSGMPPAQAQPQGAPA